MAELCKEILTAGLFDREIYLDIEALRQSHEMEGGWGNIRGFGLAVAVTWDKENGFRRWFEDDAQNLVSELHAFTRIVMFNGNRFDIEVLRAYAPVDGVRERSIDQLAHDTLGTAKSGDGLQAVEWWRAGQKNRVAKL